MTHFRKTLAAIVMLASACGGPRVPLEIGIKDYPTDIILGAQSGPEAPTPVEVVERGIPLPVQPPPRIVRTLPERTPTPTAQACPKADPLGTPPREIQGVQPRPPVPTTYSYRTTGSTKVGGLTVPLPATTQRTVKQAGVEPSGTFAFDVVTDRTTTTYRVVPRNDGLQEAGIYLVRQVTKQPEGREDAVFAPTPAILLLPFPVDNGREWDAVGTDATTQTTWVLHGKVGTLIPDPSNPDERVLSPTRRIDACGVLIDGWAVEISGPEGSGRIVSPTMDLRLNAKFAFATQYGSFSVYDETKIVGTIGADKVPFESTNTSSILSEPKIPVAP